MLSRSVTADSSTRASTTVGSLGAAAEASGYRAPGQLDLEANRARQAALTDRLVSERPAGALANPYRVEVTAEELARISETDADPRRVRIGIVKPIGESIVIAGGNASLVAPHLPLGTPAPTRDRSLVWAVTIEVDGATALRPHFTDFSLPRGAELYVYTPDAQAYGPCTGTDLLGTGDGPRMRFLVDTNVISEGTKRRPDPQVQGWLTAHEADLCVSTLTLGEIKHGIEKLPRSRRKEELQSWLTRICDIMEGRILSVNTSIAHVWGQLRAKWTKAGVAMPTVDGLLAATAKRHGLIIVTRNESDFDNSDVPSLNPFASPDAA